MGEYVLAFLLLFGSHEMGHEIEADRLNVSMQWSYGVRGVTQYYPDATQKELELITNSAFVTQDAVGNQLKNKKYSLLNGGYKLVYLMRDELDMKHISTSSKYLIALSALSDVSGQGWRFTQLNENTTGLVKTWVF